MSTASAAAPDFMNASWTAGRPKEQGGDSRVETRSGPSYAVDKTGPGGGKSRRPAVSPGVSPGAPVPSCGISSRTAQPASLSPVLPENGADSGQ